MCLARSDSRKEMKDDIQIHEAHRSDIDFKKTAKVARKIQHLSDRRAAASGLGHPRQHQHSAFRAALPACTAW